MEYRDEEIVLAKHIQRRDTYGSIEEGMYINNKLTHFEKTLICDKKIELMLPQDFVKMLPEIASNKYTSGNRPSDIYMSLDTSVNFTFNYLNDSKLESDMRRALALIKELLRRLHANYEFFTEGEEVEQDVIINWFDFKSFGIDDPAYNIMYITNINDRLLQGTFNCLYDDKNEWKRAAMEVIKTLKKTKK